MKIENKTKWDTAMLRKIFAACLAEVRKTESHWSLGRMSIKIRRKRYGGVGGYAYYDSNRITMTLPKENLLLLEGKWGELDFSQRIADTFIHEIGHCIMGKKRKHRHGDTIEGAWRGWILANISNEKYPLSIMEPIKEQRHIVSDRYDTALANLKKANTRLKRAKTIYDKWNRKVKYYEKKMAAKSTTKAEDSET